MLVLKVLYLISIFTVPSLLKRIVHHMAHNQYRRVIVVYPNSGEQWDAQHSTWKEGTGCTSPDGFADRIIEAVLLVRSIWKSLMSPSESTPPPKMIVGGCCRTSPTTIAAIRKRLDSMKLSRIAQTTSSVH
jgi:S-methylmethionine-dependent homocysteine/selenocysteine methylase